MISRIYYISFYSKSRQVFVIGDAPVIAAADARIFTIRRRERLRSWRAVTRLIICGVDSTPRLITNWFLAADEATIILHKIIYRFSFVSFHYSADHWHISSSIW